jgi:hypothetical protein
MTFHSNNEKVQFLLLTVLLIIFVTLTTYVSDKLGNSNSKNTTTTKSSSNIVGAPETHKCKDGTSFTCNGGTLGCADNSNMYCKKQSLLGAPETHKCKDGTSFTCNGGTLGCADNSDMYCKQPLLGAPETHKCKDGTSFTCNGGTLGCADNSDMYCGVNSQWDKCVEDNNCETDPATINPQWYRQGEMRDNRDIKRVRANNGMTIVDNCSIKNTNMIANPRCHITQGKFKGKIGQCFYDGQKVLPCQPAGGACKGPNTQTPPSTMDPSTMDPSTMDMGSTPLGRCIQRNDQVMFEPAKDLSHYDLCRSPY